MKSIGYLGPAGSFSHICATEVAESIGLSKFRDFPSITQIAQATSNGETDFGLLPLENSLGGSVPETLESLLKNTTLEVKLEWVFPVEHFLAGFGTEAEILEIRAHFQAFAQCDGFLKTHFPNIVRKEMSSNSAAAASLLELNEVNRKSVAAICPEQAAKIYGLQVLKSKINDSSNNFTRFWLVGTSNKNQCKQNSQRLTSIAFQIPQDEPGGLMKILTSLAKRNINMSKIESRPTRGRLCEYTFFIDFVDPLHWESIQKEVILEIQASCSMFRFLGSYSVWPEGDLRFMNSN